MKHINALNAYVGNRDPEDSGVMGDCLEMAIKDSLGLKVCVSKAGRRDMTKGNRTFEVKSGAGELSSIENLTIKGSRYVLYVPVVNMTATAMEQEGFVIERETFIQSFTDAGLVRTKASTASYRSGNAVKDKFTIQTFWNHKQGKAHSAKKYGILLDTCYENCICTLEEFLENEGRLD